MITRESLLKKAELKTEVIKLDDGEIVAKELSAEDYAATLESPLSKDSAGKYDSRRFTSLLVVRCITDKKGNRIFTDEDAEPLRNGSMTFLCKLAAPVNRVNGLEGDAKN